jgi:hypothetical protein
MLAGVNEKMLTSSFKKSRRLFQKEYKLTANPGDLFEDTQPECF